MLEQSQLEHTDDVAPAPSEDARLRVIRDVAHQVLKAETRAASARRAMHRAISDAYEADVRTSLIVDASGLTRQRIHQIVAARKQAEKA